MTEEFKKPAMILSAANSVVLSVGFFYFYNQIQTMKTDIATLQNTTRIQTTKINEFEKHRKAVVEDIKEMKKNNSVNPEELDDLQDRLESLNTDLTEVIATMNDAEIPVERASQRSLRYDYGARKTGRRDIRDRDFRDVREQTPRQDSYRNIRSRDPRQDQVKETKPKKSEEEDIIASVRQQTR